jgi:hypothetical protein
MKTMKINVPSGYEIDQEKSTFENIVFKETVKNIRERIQTMSDVYELNNMTEVEFKTNMDKLTKDEIGYKKIKLIVSAYNQGKTPNFNDGVAKYTPYFDTRKGQFAYDNYCSWYTTSPGSSRLLFLGDEARLNMLDAVKKFLPEYEEYQLG